MGGNVPKLKNPDRLYKIAFWYYLVFSVTGVYTEIIFLISIPTSHLHISAFWKLIPSLVSFLLMLRSTIKGLLLRNDADSIMRLSLWITPFIINMLLISAISLSILSSINHRAFSGGQIHDMYAVFEATAIFVGIGAPDPNSIGAEILLTIIMIVKWIVDVFLISVFSAILINRLIVKEAPDTQQRLVDTLQSIIKKLLKIDEEEKAPNAPAD